MLRLCDQLRVEAIDEILAVQWHLHLNQALRDLPLDNCQSRDSTERNQTDKTSTPRQLPSRRPFDVFQHWQCLTMTVIKLGVCPRAVRVA